MNRQIIERLMKTVNETPPELHYENPLLDKEVTKTVAKSFVKLLKLGQQKSINKKLYNSILQNIRNLCVVQVDGHAVIEADMIKSLKNTYVKRLEEYVEDKDSVDREGNIILLKEWRSCNIDSMYNPLFNTEVNQALINLEITAPTLTLLAKDLVHIKLDSNRSVNLVRQFWIRNIGINEICLKMKSHLEKLLLQTCCDILENKTMNIDNIFVFNEEIKDLVRKSSVAPTLFQMCVEILNVVFMKTNFDQNLEKFIYLFSKNAHKHTLLPSYAFLYPLHLGSAVFHIELCSRLPKEFFDDCSQKTLKLMKEIQFENDLIMLISHFPQWMDLYWTPNNSMEL